VAGVVTDTVLLGAAEPLAVVGEGVEGNGQGVRVPPVQDTATSGGEAAMYFVREGESRMEE